MNETAYYAYCASGEEGEAENRCRCSQPHNDTNSVVSDMTPKFEGKALTPTSLVTAACA